MIKKKIILNLILDIFLVAGMDAQFLSENPEHVNMAQESYVDVYYEYAELDADAHRLTPKDSKVARGFWNIAESVRKRLICESATYRVVSNIEKPAVNEMIIGSENLLAADGMVIQVEDRQGRIYRSDLSPVKARQNTWRAGYYYYDAHLLEFRLASADGDTLPLLEDYSNRRKVLLKIPDFQGALVKVDPGQPDQKVIAWQPNQVEITDNLKGSDELHLEVVLTRRNAFGPLHHNPFTYTTGPRHFLTTGENFTMNYMLYPSGLLENPRLLIY